MVRDQAVPGGVVALSRSLIAKYIKRGARVKLCSVDRKIKALFALVKLTLIYGDDLHDSEDEALASFRRILSKAGAH